MNPNLATPRTPRAGRAARIAAAAVAAVAGLGLTGCVPGNSESQNIAIVALTAEPGLMSPMFDVQDGNILSHAFVLEPLFQTMVDGSFEPYLAEEVPTVENGGVSPDGSVITMHLREGITWSDGEPLTADDLAFTVAVAQDPEGAALADPEYQSIESTTVVDDLTIELAMYGPEPGYLNLFSQVLPEHMFESTTVTPDHPQARLPLGTGPFVFDEWRSGDTITLTANEDYWRDPELPLLDGVTIKISPDQQATVGSFLRGDFDAVFFFTAADLGELKRADEGGAPIEVVTDDTRPGDVETLWLNQSAGGDPATPHPVLSDAAIRHAIDAAIDRPSIVDEVMDGNAVLTGSFLTAGFGAAQRPATPYDPDAAATLLDEAGWVLGDDGVRVKDGVRASVRFQTLSGDQERALYQQVIQQNLSDIGIELIIENVPGNVLFDSGADGGLLATGDFDIVMSRDGRYADPGLWVYTFTEDSIPTEENGWDGFTYTHWRNAQYDDLALAAATTVDRDERAALLEQIDQLMVDERVIIPVFASVLGDAWSDRLTGVSPDYWDGIWASAGTAEWALSE